jgi:UDP-N-acetyl-D-mannosaminuronic acid dehydrogenase
MTKQTMMEHVSMGDEFNAAAMASGVPASLSVIGLGYIGLPTAAMFASAGLQVVGVDVNADIVAALNAGHTHIEEGNLDRLVARVVETGALRASPTPVAADAHIIAVPTPVGESREPDLSYIMAAGRALAQVLRKGDLIILESTSPVGTTAALAELLAGERPDLVFPGHGDPDVCMAYCPERIIPGRMLEELVANDRIIGGMTPACAQRAAALYRRFVRGECLISNDRTAEMVKLAENAFRDTSIAFANELSMVCADLSINVWDVIAFANRHPRVSILNPGPGVGGHCIAVDPWFIVASDPERAKLIRTSREVNDAKTDYVIDRVEQALADAGAGTVACLGLTYKPDVDDFRESPALRIARLLSKKYPDRIVCADPYASALPAHVGGELTMVDATVALERASVVVMLVGHSGFRSLPAPRDRVIVDTIGFWR